MNEDVRKDIISIAEHFGKEKQMAKLVEELKELIEACNIYLHGDDLAKTCEVYHIMEEIADVMIVAEQVEYLLLNDGGKKLVESIKLEKIKRTKQRIKDGYYD